MLFCHGSKYTQEQALNKENAMYFALEPALMRIMGTPELMIKTASWQRGINSGYRRPSINSEHCSTRDERLGDDAICKGDFRERMHPELFAILTIRYDDNEANRISAWELVQYRFRSDDRIPKAIRTNPMILRLFIMAMSQYPELQVGKGKIQMKGKSRMTLFRWRKSCEDVCKDWISLAEVQACHLLNKAGFIADE